jgi:uncharacterized repeat protein (TIGR03803 family)
VKTLLIRLMLLVLMVPAAHAQTFTLIHSFSGGGDGATPESGLTIDAGGNLYGNTWSGGRGFGIVYKMANRGSGWTLSPLYSFAGGSDGANPWQAPISIAADGSLYGTTSGGGISNCGSSGCGTVFRLRPSPSIPHSVLSPWQETVLYRFSGAPDGANPSSGVTFATSGNMFLVTESGGQFGQGTVVELQPSGGNWTESVIFNPQGALGSAPVGNLIFDQADDIYGTTQVGGICCGTVFELTPSGNNWNDTTLHSFNGNDGETPTGPLLLDQSGNLVGTTTGGGSTSGGTAFALTRSGNNWTFSTLYTFANNGSAGPVGGLIRDAAGDLYGTTYYDGAFGWGSIFKLSPQNGGWVYTDLYDFTGQADGGNPMGNLVMDNSGNLYGIASAGGSGSCQGGCGVVWELIP